MDARARMQLGAIHPSCYREPAVPSTEGPVRVGVISVVGDFHGERQTSSSNTRCRSRARRYANYGGTASRISSFADTPPKAP